MTQLRVRGKLSARDHPENKQGQIYLRLVTLAPTALVTSALLVCSAVCYIITNIIVLPLVTARQKQLDYQKSSEQVERLSHQVMFSLKEMGNADHLAGVPSFIATAFKQFLSRIEFSPSSC